MKISNKISIIVPTYNRAWCLERAIKSVLNQNNSEWELVIIDDGSNDNTKKIVEKYLNSKIKYFFKTNGGVGSARNFGVSKASYDYVTFLDSDDELVPEAISEMNNDIFLFYKKKVKLILYLAKKKNYINYNNNYINDLSIINFKDAVQGRWPQIETLQLIKKELFQFYGFPEVSGGLENIFWLSILKEKTNALLRKKYLRIYHTDHEDRLTGSKQIISRSKTLPKLYNIFLNKFGNDFKILNPKKLAYFYFEKSIFEIIDNQKKEGRKDLLTALKYNSNKIIIIYIIYTLTILPNKYFIKLATIGHKFKNIIK